MPPRRSPPRACCKASRTIYLNLMRVFEMSKSEGIPTNVVADRVAEKRIATIQRLGSRQWSRMLRGRRA